MQSLLLCLLLAAAIGAARAEVCPDGLEGPDCGMCIGGSAIGDAACVNMTDYASAFCYSNHTWADGSTSKTYDCSTEVRLPLMQIKAQRRVLPSQHTCQACHLPMCCLPLCRCVMHVGAGHGLRWHRRRSVGSVLR
jgi:hypothetical protein